jgi:hypothetical protein
MVLGGWLIQVPAPVALAFAATLGYMVGRWHRPAPKAAKQPS